MNGDRAGRNEEAVAEKALVFYDVRSILNANTFAFRRSRRFPIPSIATRVIVVGLALLAIVSLWRAFAVEHERRQLLALHQQTQQQLQQVESERTELTGELFKAKQTIESQATDLAGYRHELDLAQERLQRAATELASLKQEEETLNARNAALVGEVSDITAQKQTLEAKLTSLVDLRQAIRNVKHKLWEQRLAAWRQRIEAAREEDRQRLASGNRGYVVRDGTSTLAASPRLRVHVLEPQAQ